MKSDDYDSEAADELSLSLHDSDSEEECSSPKAKISKIVLSEAEKRCKKNIQEREQLWEQQKDKYENMFSFKWKLLTFDIYTLSTLLYDCIHLHLQVIYWLYSQTIL